MKPLSLTLQAFGPFATRQHINFKMLGDNPLFLINGPTGAGKSSILDAICFALYGETTVEDAYTGKTRPVATLSGGESFMAALALGLSDVVQAYAGGIRLDMLFIDEGFGSLDQASLDLAIRTLIDLQASGRMIGIISHVSELKEQMALRLDVLAGRQGSTTRLIA